MGFIVGKYDVIVVGAGHAGVEAALAVQVRVCVHTRSAVKA